MWKYALTLSLMLWFVSPLLAHESNAQSTTAEPVAESAMPPIDTSAVMMFIALSMIPAGLFVTLLLIEKDSHRTTQLEATSAILENAQQFRESIRVFAKYTEDDAGERQELLTRLTEIDRKIGPLMTIGSQVELQAASTKQLQASMKDLGDELNEAKKWLRSGSG